MKKRKDAKLVFAGDVCFGVLMNIFKVPTPQVTASQSTMVRGNTRHYAVQCAAIFQLKSCNFLFISGGILDLDHYIYTPF